MARYRRRDLGQEHTALRPPVVTLTAQIYFGPLVNLTPSKRGVPKSKLFPPSVIGAGIAWHGPGTYLVPSTNIGRRPQFSLKPPVVIGAGIVNPPLRIKLIPITTRDEPRQAKSRFIVPTVIGVGIVYRPLQVKITYSLRGIPVYKLQPPVVTDPKAFRGIATKLTIPSEGYRKAQDIAYALIPPAHVDTRTYRGPGTYLTLSKRGVTKSKLSAPAVVVQQTEVFYGPLVNLAAPLPRFNLLTSIYIFPVVVFQTKALGGIGVTLAPQRRGIPKSKLQPPAVVIQVAQVYYPLFVNLTYSRRGIAKSDLGFPQIVTPLSQTGFISLTFAPQSRGKTKSKLRSPAHIQVDPNRPLIVHLTYSKRGIPKSVLAPPAHVQVDTNRPVQTHLAYSRRGKSKSKLFEPIIPPLAPPIETEIAVRIARLEPRLDQRSKLLPPTIVGASIAWYGPGTYLTYSLRGKAKSKLVPPAVVGKEVIYELAIKLTYPSRGIPQFKLQQPVVIGAGIVNPSLRIKLAPLASPQNIPPVFNKLTPPVVISERIYFGPSVTIAQVNKYITVPTLFKLQPPVVTDPKAFRGLAIKLIPLLGRPSEAQFKLSPPVVVGYEVFYGPFITLAPSKFGKPKSRLAPPAHIDRRVYFGPGVIISFRVPIESPKRQAKYKLFAPTVVASGEIFRPLLVVLTVQKTLLPYELKIKSKLKTPSVIRPSVAFRGPRIKLTPILNRRLLIKSALHAPAVVNPFVPPEAPVITRPPGDGGGTLHTVVGGPKVITETIVNRSITLHRVEIVSRIIRIRSSVSTLSVTNHSISENIYIDPAYKKAKQKADEEFIKKLIDEDLI